METVAVDLHGQADMETKAPKSPAPEEIVGQSSDKPHRPPPPSASELGKSHGKDPPPGVGGGGEEGVDIISSLPDAVLGEIIFLLPTKDAARTQTLSSRWRHVWCSAPLNIDHVCLSFNGNDLVAFISRIIDAHQGPVRRLSVPERYLFHRCSEVKAWLRSLALDNLQELEFYSPPLPRFRYTKSNSLPCLRRELLGNPTPPNRKCMQQPRWQSGPAHATRS